MKTPRTFAFGIVSLILTASAALALIDRWDGGGGTDLLSDGFNWQDNTSPASDLLNTDLIFRGTIRPTPNVAAAFSVHSITFDNTATAFTIDGQALSIGTGGITNNDADPQTFSNLGFIDFSSVANSVIDAAAGPLRFTNVVRLPTITLTVTGGFNTEFRDISYGAIAKQGTGTMIWTPPAIQQANATVNAGTLRFGADGSPDVLNFLAGLSINGTSALEIDESLTLDAAHLTRASGATITLAAGKTLRVQNGGDARRSRVPSPMRRLRSSRWPRTRPSPRRASSASMAAPRCKSPQAEMSRRARH